MECRCSGIDRAGCLDNKGLMPQQHRTFITAVTMHCQSKQPQSDVVDCPHLVSRQVPVQLIAIVGPHETGCLPGGRSKLILDG